MRLPQSAYISLSVARRDTPALPLRHATPRRKTGARIQTVHPGSDGQGNRQASNELNHYEESRGNIADKIKGGRTSACHEHNTWKPTDNLRSVLQNDESSKEGRPKSSHPREARVQDLLAELQVDLKQNWFGCVAIVFPFRKSAYNELVNLVNEWGCFRNGPRLQREVKKRYLLSAEMPEDAVEAGFKSNRHANHVILRKREQKGCKKGRRKGVQSGDFTVALFPALFALTLLLYLVNFIATKFISSLLNPFYTTELKRGKKPGEKRKEWEKGRKKGAKKGGKRATVNDPNLRCEGSEMGGMKVDRLVSTASESRTVRSMFG
ncbi:hypothetical protein B0H16DRAFT_1701981 [Mycena metata]|uniref:Uncharacterized protein n=1 Tax=Mycena metata TaxID=1033252 RepID=A0AAD7H8W9_9AGAR|nr:hypothetical protein B0H16DRAFT_1701981 [Mycena metata]